jgi:hypothetical protein
VVNAESALNLVPNSAPPPTTPVSSVPTPAPSVSTPVLPMPAAPPAPTPGGKPGDSPSVVHDVLVNGLEVPAAVRRDTSLRATATVANAGGEEEAVAVGLFDQTTGTWLRTAVVTLKPGQSAKVDFQWNVGPVLGVHSLVAYALLPGGIPDDKPGNNQKTTTLEVQKGLLTVAVTPAKSPFRPGDVIDLTVQVRDALGPAAAAAARVSIYAPGGFRIFDRTLNTNVDGTVEVRLSRYSSRYGLGTFRVEVTANRDGYETLTHKTGFDLKQ